MSSKISGVFNHEEKTSFYVWKNIYGSPMGCKDSDIKNKMNNDPDFATNFKGRILMEIECFKTQNPESKVVHFNRSDYYEESRLSTIPQRYKLFCEIGQAIALPSDKKYSIKVLIGGEELETGEPQVAMHRYNRFNKRFGKQENRRIPDPVILELPYQSIKEMGSMFILLLDENKKPVCYHREEITNFRDVDAEFKWVQLKPDPVVGVVNDFNDAGLLSFKMTIVDDKADLKEVM